MFVSPPPLTLPTTTIIITKKRTHHVKATSNSSKPRNRHIEAEAATAGACHALGSWVYWTRLFVSLLARWLTESEHLCFDVCMCFFPSISGMESRKHAAHITEHSLDGIAERMDKMIWSGCENGVLLLWTYLPSNKMFSCIWDAIVQWCLVWSFALKRMTFFCAFVRSNDRKLFSAMQRNFCTYQIEININQWFKFLSSKSFWLFVSKIRRKKMAKVLAKKEKDVQKKTLLWCTIK